jgi:glycine betaine/proline transport system permease protein
VVAVPLGVAGGLGLGILAWRNPWFERALRPVLDLMQTMPVFAYLVPILILFGFGPTAAVIATLIYATPPMTRITTLALSRVPPETHDLATMVGCTPRQRLWRVLVPSAREPLLVGVNQVIMLSLNMVIIASMIGAGGLGFEVLNALRRLDFGTGLEAGLAIVALAIALDRLSQAIAHRSAGAAPKRGVARHPYLLAAVAFALGTGLIGLMLPAVQTYPEAAHLSTSPFWAALVEWINVTFFDTLEAVKNAILTWVLMPAKRFLLGLPWLGVVALLGLVGWRLGGLRLGLLCTGLSFLIAATGQWEKAMITVYLCGISTLIAMAIGLPIAIWVAERDRWWTVTRLVIDTLQTLPSFVYLMPIVMLFRVGDFTAMIAVVAYAVVASVRYTALGLQGVDPRLIEAGRAMGCTPLQILTRIRLRLALPEILLGLNQTIMFALSMLVITALVGTRDLGQDVYIALTKANPGNGLVAGLAIAFIAIIADRLLSAAARSAREKLGLEGAT